jgi:hypothetical protein
MQQLHWSYGAVVLLMFVTAGVGWHRYSKVEMGNHVAASRKTADGAREVTLLSVPHTIDRTYESMTGPRSIHPSIELGKSLSQPGLLWITGIRSEMVGLDGITPLSSDFFCHSNLEFSGASRRVRQFNGDFTGLPDFRLATLIPGRMDLRLPYGFGIPVYSDEQMHLFTMSLNLNKPDTSLQVRFKTTISIVPQATLNQNHGGMKPLFRRALYGYEESRPKGQPWNHRDHGAEAAAMGQTAPHWLIAPGPYRNTVPVNEQMQLTDNATVHFATAHLHPYARSLSLRDVTTGETLIVIRSKDLEGRRGVADMETWVSEAGVRVARDHRYELVTVYENTTDKPIDAMAILYLYMLDERFVTTLARNRWRQSGDN